MRRMIKVKTTPKFKQNVAENNGTSAIHIKHNQPVNFFAFVES